MSQPLSQLNSIQSNDLIANNNSMLRIKNLNAIIGSFEEHYGSKKGHHYKKGHKKGYDRHKYPIPTHIK